MSAMRPIIGQDCLGSSGSSVLLSPNTSDLGLELGIREQLQSVCIDSIKEDDEQDESVTGEAGGGRKSRSDDGEDDDGEMDRYKEAKKTR